MTAKEKVLALLDAANEATGESDADLTSAVGTLIDGYGQGGAATQAELDSIAGKVGGIATPSTPASIEAQADDLIADANAATGESDTTLTDAVGSLIDAMPTGSISITENGTVDVAQYAQAVVNVPSGGRTVIGTYVPTSGGINKYITHNAGFDNYVCFIWADANDQSAVEQDAITNNHASLVDMITWRMSNSPVSYVGVSPFGQNEFVGRYNKSSGYASFLANSADNTATRTKIGNIYVAGGVTYHYAVCEVILQ